MGTIRLMEESLISSSPARFFFLSVILFLSNSYFSFFICMLLHDFLNIYMYDELLRGISV